MSKLMARRKRKPSIGSLRNKLERKLLEAQTSWIDTLVDPRDAYTDEVTGERWRAAGSTFDTWEEEVEPFTNEEELGLIRRKAKQIVRSNSYAENLLVNLVSFVIGSGHRYNCTPKEGTSQNRRAKEMAGKLQRYVDKLLKMNRWNRRQKEAYRRKHRDGEAFIRIFPQESGYVHFRFIEPHEVSTPDRWRSDPAATFGILTDPDDVETVLSYFVGDEEVDAGEVQHRKANVDMNCKRGLSSIYTIGTNLERGAKLLRNMSILVQTQSAIAMIRKHKKTSGAVRNFVSRNATATSTNAITGEQRNYKKLRPGTIIDTKDGSEYEFPSISLNPSAPVNVLAAELRAVASSKALPEFMVGSDASNANYASTMVAESPAVRYFQGEQEETIEDDLELIWTAVNHAIEVGRLPPEVRSLVEITVEPPNLIFRDVQANAAADEVYMRNKVKSPQTVAGELGLDAKQEMRNWSEFDDAVLDNESLPMPGSPVVAGAAGGAAAAVANKEPEAALLSMAGGITGAVEIMKAVKEQTISRESAIQMFMMFYRLDESAAIRMVGRQGLSKPRPVMEGKLMARRKRKKVA